MPDLEIAFHGAARTVTGSMHELRADGRRYLLDCGLYQGRRQQARRINRDFPFPPHSIDAVLLSHAHIDHSGNLPSLARAGYAGPIYCTPATAALCDPMLKDSAHIQESDARFLNKKISRRRSLLREVAEEDLEPLYTGEDAAKAISLLRPAPMRKPLEVGPGLLYESFEAGHMLGSTFMKLTCNGVRLLFSGDLGRRNLPIIRDPDPPPEADYLILESTYGDRLHKDIGSVSKKLADIVTRTAGRGGKVVAPSFAVGRAQALLVLIADLIEGGAIPKIPVFVDSPLAVDVTEVFAGHQDLFDEETTAFLARNREPGRFNFVRFIRETSESKALNELRLPCVIISASGMCEAGRILHHLRNNIGDSRNTVLITGFQAENTLGRKLVDGWKEVPILGDVWPVRAEIAKINELSGHADQHEILQWMKPAAAGLKRVFLVHGEPGQQEPLAREIEDRYGIETVIPSRGDVYALD